MLLGAPTPAAKRKSKQLEDTKSFLILAKQLVTEYVNKPEGERWGHLMTHDDKTDYEKLKQEFPAVLNISASCASTKVLAAHSHRIAKYQSSMKMANKTSFQKGTRSYNMKPFDKKEHHEIWKSLADIVAIRHMLTSAAYIQLEKGWHNKTDHTHPAKLENLHHQYQTLHDLYGSYLVHQHLYIKRSLIPKIKKYEQKLKVEENEKHHDKYQKRLVHASRKLKRLRVRWGHEETHTEEQLQASKVAFLNDCTRDLIEK